ncbi:hypothetical protein H6F40_19740, partial [Microcystis wesenbergii FACHB-1339]|nr:hypothetical protein [Microcystis wesenbergii FACHB-1339]
FFDTPQTPEKPLFLQRVNGYEPYQASSLTFLSPLEELITLLKTDLVLKFDRALLLTEY